MRPNVLETGIHIVNGNSLRYKKWGGVVAGDISTVARKQIPTGPFMFPPVLFGASVTFVCEIQMDKKKKMKFCAGDVSTRYRI
jgi:hypothetical protein